MSGSGPRESIFPTRMALTNTKLRLKGAQTGHSLLAKKRDALTTRFRSILRKVDEVRFSVPFIVSSPDYGQFYRSFDSVSKVQGWVRVDLVDVRQLVG